MNTHLINLYKKVAKKNKNEFEKNILKNFISFYLEKKRKEEETKKENSILKQSDNFETEHININLKKNLFTINITNGNLIEPVNFFNKIKIFKSINKEIIKDIQIFNEDCIYNNLNLNYITNKLITNNNIYIKIEKNSNLSINIINKNEFATDMISQNIFFIIEKKSKIKIFDYYINNSNLIHNSNINIYQKEFSKVNYYLINENNKKNSNFFSVFSKQLKNSYLELRNFSTKEECTDYIYNFFLIGKNTIIKNYSSNILKENQQSKTICNAIHYGKSSESYIIKKAVTKENSKLNFKGNVNVSIETEEVKSDLKCNGIILSDTSSIEFIPELSINNKNVICSHGATIGHIDENIIKYMKSRGVSYKECIKIIIESFFKETINNDIIKVKKFIYEK